MPRRGEGRAPPPPEMRPATRAVLAALGVLGGVLMVLVALTLTTWALNALLAALNVGNTGFVVGALLLVALAMIGVAVAGPSLLKGTPFHLAGVLGPFLLAGIVPPFERLRLAGGVIYIAAWCWTYLGETVVRVVRGRTKR